MFGRDERAQLGRVLEARLHRLRHPVEDLLAARVASKIESFDTSGSIGTDEVGAMSFDLFETW